MVLAERTAIQTRLQPPRTASRWIARPRLLRRLELGRGARLVLVQAPAGYGKTCLLAQGFAAERAVRPAAGWLTFDAGDRDPIVMLTDLAAACGDACGGASEAEIGDFGDAGSFAAPEVVVAALASRFTGRETPAVIYLDDVHLLNGSPAWPLLWRFSELAGPGLRLVMASRTALEAPLARLRALGELVELGTADLRFGAEETTAFLAGAAPELDRGTAERLGARTEGWIVGLKLACFAIRGSADPSRAPEAFSGERREVADFFAEDVFARLEPELQDFLMETSVLDRLCPALCDAMTGTSNGRRMLDEVEASGLFLASLDEHRTWYRLHQLFAEFLRRRLRDRRPGATPRLHLRASDWFGAADLYLEAFDHAIKAEEPTLAAEILDRRCDQLFEQGQETAILRLADQIPEAVRARYPGILLATAWRLLVQWKFGQARELLDICQERLAEMADREEAPPTELRRLECLLLHRRAMQAVFEDNLGLAQAVSERLLHDHAEIPPYVRGTVHSTLLAAQREQFRLRDVDRLESLTRENLARSSSRYVLVFFEAMIGPIRLLMGQTEAAGKALQRGLDIAHGIAGAGSPLAAVVALPLAELQYERGDLGAARQLLDGHLAHATEHGFVDQLIAGWITRARLLALDDDLGAALRVLEEAAGFGAGRGFERLRLHALAERIDLLVRAGRAEPALGLRRELGLQRAPACATPGPAPCRNDEIRARAWTRLAQAEGRGEDALPVARAWRRITETAGAVRSQIHWEIALARLQAGAGDVLAGRRTLAQAVQRAAPLGLVRSFVDEARALAPLLPEPADSEQAALVEAIRKASGRCAPIRTPAGAEDETGVPRALSQRELEILRLVGSGLLNKEIGYRLGMTEGTVKWRLQRVYDKIGARRRSQAVAKARQFGLGV